MTDYYKESDKGCCLLCDNAKKGCLCYDCKCKKCEWYNQNEMGGECGHIDIIKSYKTQQKKSYSNQKKLFGGQLVKNEQEYFCYLQKLQRGKT